MVDKAVTINADVKEAKAELEELIDLCEELSDLVDELEAKGVDLNTGQTQQNDTVSVADLTLEADNGGVVVKEDGVRHGNITAQGLIEAAKVSDKALSALYARECGELSYV